MIRRIRPHIEGRGIGARAGESGRCAEAKGNVAAVHVQRVRPDQAAAAPVLKLEGVTSPVVIDSIRLLRKDGNLFVHVRSRDGAEGISLDNGRASLMAPVLYEQIVPYLAGKDIRDLETHLWELYRFESNYKLQGLLFWSAQAAVEFAILDMLGRITGKSMGDLLGGVVRREVPFYVASGRRDTTPEQEVEYLQGLIQETGAKAVKFRLGGRMSRNADALPGRTSKLIPLTRKTFGSAIDLHGDANSSYDPPQAIEIGRLAFDLRLDVFEHSKAVGAHVARERCCVTPGRRRWLLAFRDELRLGGAGAERSYDGEQKTDRNNRFALPRRAPHARVSRCRATWVGKIILR